MHARCQLLSGRVSAQGVALRTAQSAQRAYATTTSDPTPAVKNPLQRRRGGDLGSHIPRDIIPGPPLEPQNASLAARDEKSLLKAQMKFRKMTAEQKKAHMKAHDNARNKPRAYIPPYPYGDHQLFKQANRGLYGDQMIRFGNNVSKDTETKTRRNWKPNVLSKSLYSIALKKRIKLRITAKVLKTMDREGGLDEYLLKDNVARIKEMGPLGWQLRWVLMQRPDVIDRLRADAAALGLDQATIDKQWPTPQMKTEQKAAEGALAQEEEVSTEDVLSGEFVETEEQEMWGPEAEADLTTVQRQEREVAAKAATEYTKAVKAAQRYLTRGVVDSEEEGLKLAFIRAKEREEAAAQLKSNSNKKYLEADFSAEDLQEIRTKFNLPNIKDHTARKIAYNQRKRKEIDEAGGVEAWQASKEGFKARAAHIEAAGGIEAIRATKKIEYAGLISEAETAATNEALSAERRVFLEDAISKADMAIRAKAGAGEDDYVEATLEEIRRQGDGGLGEIFEQSRKEKGATGDAWGALVNSSNRPAEEQPRA